MVKKLTIKQIQDTYKLIKKMHKKYLAAYGVKLPGLTNKNGNYSKESLVLIYLAYGYPKTSVVSKTELTDFVKQYYPNNTNDVQQARHLGAQYGWFILSGKRNDNASGPLKSGEYKLETLEKPYPDFTAERRNERITTDEWEAIKKKYKYCCACCGSKEGEPHRYWTNTTTSLQKGHKDPNKPLEKGNIIPQCSKCNQPDRNYWIYDDKGRVVQIANAEVIDRCSEKVKKEIYKRLYKKFQGLPPEEL